MSQLTICLIIFVLTIVGYCTSVISLGTTAILSLVALSITGCLKPAAALAYFSNANVIMIAGMCIVAAGFNKTQFCVNLANGISKIAKGSLNKLMFGYVFIGMILSQFIQSPVVVFGIVAPMLMASAESMGLKSSKVMLPLGIVTVVTCCTLPLGAGATVPAELNGYIESYGYTAYTVGFFQPMIARLPLLIVTVIYCAFFAPKIAPNEPVVPTSFTSQAGGKKEKLPQAQETAAIIIFFADAVALMFAQQLHLANWQITVIGALLMVIFRVLKPKEATNAIPMSMLLLIVGALAMSGALSATGAGELIGNAIASFAQSVGGNSYIIGFVFFIVPFVLTQFMQNRGVMVIFHPIAIATCASMGANPSGLMILIQAACLSAFMTPMATAAIPYIMDYGGYDQVSMIKQSLPFCVVCCLVSVLWIMTIYPIM